MNTPAVSVIVPNYNHARFLRRRLDTILGQTYQGFELILLDDCSTDGSQAILQEYASDPRLRRNLSVRLELNDANSGSSFKQWNKGVRLAQGKYVWIAESDDYADTGLLSRLVAALDADAGVTIAYCRSQCISAEDDPLGYADSLYFPEFEPQSWTADFCIDGHAECRTHLVRYNTVPNASGVVFRREIFERVGGADESLRLCGDWKLWAAMALEGKIAYLSEPLSFYRVHQASVTQTVDFARTHVLEWLRVIRWVLGRVTPPENVLQALYEHQASRWVPVLVSMRVPLEVKVNILREARAIDPHLLRSARRSARRLVTRGIRQGFCNVWYGMLNVTYKARHAAGLTREGLAQMRAKLGRSKKLSRSVRRVL